MKRRDFLKGALIGSGLLSSGLFTGSGRTNDWGKRKHGKDFYRIDSYCHFAPVDYMNKLDELNFPLPANMAQRAIFANNPSMVDVNARLNMMDDCEIDVSILVPSPFLEAYPNVYNDPAKAVQAAQFINNEIANIAAQHPTRFKGVAILPTLNADIMLTEFDRAVNQLNAVGGCFVVSPTAKPPDHSDYLQLYAKAVQLNVPLWMHPSRPATYADYTSDVPQISKYYLFMLLGWILDSSVAMARIVFKGVFDTYPDLKIIAHHKGAITALFQNRLTYGYLIEQNITQNMPTVSQPYVEHFKKFYVDTAFSGNESFETEIVKIAYDFFGADHVVFGTDAPLSTNSGREGTLNARHSVEELRVPNKDIKNIFSNNILKIIPH